MMNKFLIAMFATLALSACQKPADAPAEPKGEVKTEQAPTQTAEKPADKPAETAEPKKDDHAHGHSHTHGHGEHGHHHHHDGEMFQCGDKKVNIAVHNHEGQMEAHATIDDIEYDLALDTAKPNHYTTAEGLNNQAMVMHLDGDKATFKTADDKPLLDCQKAPNS